MPRFLYPYTIYNEMFCSYNIVITGFLYSYKIL